MPELALELAVAWVLLELERRPRAGVRRVFPVPALPLAQEARGMALPLRAQEWGCPRPVAALLALVLAAQEL